MLRNFVIMILFLVSVCPSYLSPYCLGWNICLYVLRCDYNPTKKAVEILRAHFQLLIFRITADKCLEKV